MIEVVRQCICCVGRIDASAQTSSSLIGCPARSMQQFGWSNRGTYSGLARAANVSLRIECASEERPAWTETGARAQRRDHLAGRSETRVERDSFGWDGTVHGEPLSIQVRVRTLSPYSATESIPCASFTIIQRWDTPPSRWSALNGRRARASDGASWVGRRGSRTSRRHERLIVNSKPAAWR